MVQMMFKEYYIIFLKYVTLENKILKIKEHIMSQCGLVYGGFTCINIFLCIPWFISRFFIKKTNNYFLEFLWYSK